MKPGLLRAVLGAAIGAAVGLGALMLATGAGLIIEDGQRLGLAYLLALIGFLFGIGAFRFWVT